MTLHAKSIDDRLYVLLESFLICFAIAIVCSTTLMTISAAGLFLTWLLYGYFSTKSVKGIGNQFITFFKNKECVSFSLIYLISIIGLFYSSDINKGINELTVKLPLLFMPVFFSGFPAIKRKTIFHIIIAHCAILIFASILILINYFKGNINCREYYPYISHIRLSLNYCFSCTTLIYLLYNFKNRIPNVLKIVIVFLILWFITSIFFTKTLTGIISLFAVILTLIISYLFVNKSIGKRKKYIVICFLIAILLTPFGYFEYAYHKYYDCKMDFSHIDTCTVNGNPYSDNNTNTIKKGIIEEGYYIDSYICEKELRQEWNKRSQYDYDNFSQDGTQFKYTLIRYLNSLGYRKDSVGVSKLTDKQIHEIEQNIANANYSKFGFYSRLSSSFYSYEIFKKTNNPTGSSLMQRICAWDTSIKAIKKHPLFGYGTGEVKNTLFNYYDIYYPKYSEEYRIETHNQYLFFAIQSGIVGLIIFLFGFIYPGIHKHKFTDCLWITIFIISTLSMFYEDTLGTQAGVTFVTFFYFILLFSENKNNYENQKAGNQL